MGDQGQLPLISYGLGNALVPGLNGQAANLNGPAASKKLAYLYVEPNGRTNIDLGNGTVRFWFKPDWTSATDGGSGPATGSTNLARLLSFGAWTTNASIGSWELVLNPGGDTVSLRVQDNLGNSVSTPNMVIPGGMLSNQWHQIVATYTPSESAIYVDAALLGTGPGLNSLLPPASILEQGFFLGSDNVGAQKGNGTFDGLETFNYPLSSAEITAGYSNSLYFADTDNDKTADGWERSYFGNLNQSGSGDYDNDGLSNLQELLNSSNPTVANAPTLLSGPQSQTVLAGSDVNLRVMPVGSVLGSYRFQWWWNGRPIEGATNGTLSLSQVQLTNSGNYSVSVSNTAGAVSSPLARLTVWTTGTLAVWGGNDYGQTNILNGLSNVVVGACAARAFSMALKNDGTLVGWGWNGEGEITVPVTATNVAAIAVGSWHTLALKEEGKVVSWGYNAFGQASVPESLSNVVEVAGGYGHSLALKNDGTVVAWGRNNQGQASVPGSATNIVAVAAGYDHSLALRSDGTVIGWGLNGSGQINVPSGLSNVVAICGGNDLSGAVRADGSVVLWGNVAETNVPASATNVLKLACESYGHPEHLLALRRDGVVVAWGNNSDGQSTVPASLGDGVGVSAGYYHSLCVQVNDVDGDSLPGAWERSYFGNLNQSGSGDYDNDGLSNLREYIENSNPTNYTAARLASWRFNDNRWPGDQGQTPLSNLGLNTSLVLGLEGGAIDMSATNGAKLLSYWIRETNGNENIRLGKGTVRFWFKPSWSSVSKGGTGPGSAAKLLYVGTSTNESAGYWNLGFDSAGDALVLAAGDNLGNSVSRTISITNGVQSNQWYQIAAAYRPSLEIFVNGTSMGVSNDLGIVPIHISLDQGFFLGTDDTGALNCKGMFEFLETFNYKKSSSEILAEYNDSDGDGVSNDQDGDVTNPLIRGLTVTIEKPGPGTVITR
jgi:hypothetical protein